MSQDITYCGYNKCPYTDCERHQSNIKDFSVTHHFAYFHDCSKYPPLEFSKEEIQAAVINRKLLTILEDRFDKLQAYLDRVFQFEEGEDLYAFVASIMYNKDIDECREMNPDGTLNPEGKERRNRAKQFILPVVAECGGLLDETEGDTEETNACFYCKHNWRSDYEEPCNKCKHSYDNKFERDITKYPSGDTNG